MSDLKAYTYHVNPFGSGAGEHNLVHVTNSSWVLTFIRWKYRDTYRVSEDINQNPNANPNALQALKTTLDPLVVINDCINVSVTSNKSSFTPYMEATLLQTDVNYLTAVAPGDFVAVNMVNWESHATEIYNRANSANPGAINGFNDGFKGLFKVQSVRRTTSIVEPRTGKRSVVFKITGYAFTEFNNMLYFDPSVAIQNPDNIIFSGQIANKWKSLLNANKNQSIQTLIQTLISSFIGDGNPRNATQSITGTQFQTPNDQYFMPGIIGQLLGTPWQVRTASDIFTYIFGIQKYSNTGSIVTPTTGLNPDIPTTGIISENGLPQNGFFFTQTPCAGRAILSPEYWNQVKAWDILSQYINGPLNEFFTSFRASPYNGSVMPTVILRQIPFTNEDFFMNDKSFFAQQNVSVGNVPVTMFMTVPRWKIHPAMVIAQDIGRDEALRINYVQVFAKILQGTDEGSDYTLESTNHNYQYDTNDIQRSGLRCKVTASMFDLYGDTPSTPAYNSPIWAAIQADALIGGHLKMSGTFICAGIQAPIAIGDNLEFEDTVYHIEKIVHTGSVDPTNGIKTFRTIISVSSGISIYSNAVNGTSYPEMEHTNAYAEREWDYTRSQILPGTSESQAVPYRLPNVDDTKPPLDKPNNSLPQPSQTGVFPDHSGSNNNNGQ